MANKPARFLLATFGSLGDLHPMVALAMELRRRGHEVAVASTDFYRRKVESLGIPFHAVRPNQAMDDPELYRYVLDARRGPEYVISKVLLPALRGMYEDLSAAAENADFLVAGELLFAAPIVAEKLGLKWASIILSPSSFFSAHDPSVIAPAPFTRHLLDKGRWLNRTIVNLVHWAARHWAAPIHELRAELGLRASSKPLFEDKCSPHLNLAMFSPLLAQPQPDWPASTVQTGFVFFDQHPQDIELSRELREFLDAGDPPIVFTLGSGAVVYPGTFYRESIEAVRRLGRRAILLVGGNAPQERLPEGVVAFDYAPYSELLPRAACIVHSGGSGTVAQALRAGRPQLVMPFVFDQPDNAVRCERIGAGRFIARSQYTAERATVELQQLLDSPRYAQRAADLAEQLRAEDGVRLACDALEHAQAA
jgi:UDP:flavonoid glycosyltransferase YjiC (YdhE family)